MSDDLTGVEDRKKQEALDVILFNIRQMFHHGIEGDVISETVLDISLKEIDAFLDQVSRKQSTDIKLFRVRSAYLEDPMQVDALYDYVEIGLQGRKEYKQILYFIEGGDFAFTFIPIEEGRGNIRIHMEPLECCPDFITEKFNELENGKSIDSIKFVKLQ